MTDAQAKKKGYIRIKPGTMAAMVFPGKKYFKVEFAKPQRKKRERVTH